MTNEVLYLVPSLEKLLTRPVLVAVWELVLTIQVCEVDNLEDILAIRQISAHDQRDLLLAELFYSNLQRIGFSLQVH